ncbi:MAG TPA: hypothetical protein VNB24_07480 [Acidimicrobiales bacterium]|nr:hypothetical protein [Acidimicrobiales bacterium]
MTYNPTGSPEHFNTSGPEPVVGEAFSYGWNKFKSNFGAIVLCALVFFVIQAVGFALQAALQATRESTTDAGTAAALDGTAIISSLVFNIVSMLAQLGVIRAALAIVDGRRPEPADLFSVDRFGNYLLAIILIGIGTTIGTLLFVLPGIIFYFVTYFTPYFVLDKRMTAIGAMGASISLVRSHFGAFFVFALACIGAFILGAIALLVGLLIAMPVVQIATAYNFRKTTDGAIAP